MFKNFRCRKAQSVLEYAMLIIIIVTALTAMSLYIQRAINARMKQVQAELDENKR
ncbi:MAG: hypothetical protein PHO70_01085 [Candidatus Omnitrophica bacterium]|nr:hypothetical protein [Candidatus Omnitrophota bacterium]